MTVLSDLWPFGKKHTPAPPKRTPSMGAGTTGVGDSDIGARRVPVESTQPTATAPVPSVPLNLPTPPVTPTAKPDRIFVDGEEVDSYVDPERNVVVKTVLTPVKKKQGGHGALKIVVTAEPLDDPADRKKLKDALHTIDAHTKYLGAVQLWVTAWPTTFPVIMLSAPTWTLYGEGIQVQTESSSGQFRYLKLYFYGDGPMRVEFEFPYVITQQEIPAWAWPAFVIEHYAKRGDQREDGDKEVRIA